MIRFLAIAFILIDGTGIVNSEEYGYGPLQTAPSKPITIDSLTTQIGNLSGNGSFSEDATDEYENNSSPSTDFQFSTAELIKKCDGKRTLNNCEKEIANTSRERVKHGNGELSSREEEIEGLVLEDLSTFPGRPTTASAETFMDVKSKTIGKGPLDYQVSVTDAEHAVTSPVTTEDDGGVGSQLEEVSSTNPAATGVPRMTTPGKSALEKSDKVSLRRPWDSRPTTPPGLENFVKIRNATDETHTGKRQRIHEIIRLANDSQLSTHRQPIMLGRPNFGKIRYSKPRPENFTKMYSTTERSETQLIFSTFFPSTTFYNRVPIGVEVNLEPSARSKISTFAIFNETGNNGTPDKVPQEIPWPVKKESIVEGDIILGGLMMVHEREDSITCGPVMPQGGIQALEAMLFTLDQLNSSPEPLLPNITLGAHILDDCDKDTYGLEMAVDFIKVAAVTLERKFTELAI